MKPALLAAALVAGSFAGPGWAWAEGHAVTIRNGGGETIRSIYFGGGSDSRLRHELPQGAEARITFSTSCRTDIRIAYASGRTEEHPEVEVCTDPHIVAGQGGTAGPDVVAAPAASSSPVAGSGSATGAKGSAATAKLATPAAAVIPSVKAPPPVVPPWTGKSITKRFGGMD